MVQALIVMNPGCADKRPTFRTTICKLRILSSRLNVFHRTLGPLCATLECAKSSFVSWGDITIFLLCVRNPTEKLVSRHKDAIILVITEFEWHCDGGVGPWLFPLEGSVYMVDLSACFLSNGTRYHASSLHSPLTMVSVRNSEWSTVFWSSWKAKRQG